MDIKRRIAAHNQRWGIESVGIDLKGFKQRLERFLFEYIDLEGADGDSFPDDIERDFSIIAGVPWYSGGVIYRLKQATSFGGIVTTLQHLFWALEENKSGLVKRVVNAVNEAIRYTPSVSIEVARRGYHVTLYPAGAKLLDDTSVNESLDWLKTYPTVSEQFEQALAIYLARDVKKYRNLLDNLRFAVEQLLKVVLGNRKSLENQKEPLLRWLAARGVHSQLAGMFHDLLFGKFALYQNDAVKHDQKWRAEEIEFAIYLSGTFMRFLLQLHGTAEVSTTDHA